MFERGKAITAGALNALARAARSARVTAGDGIDIAQTDEGSLVSVSPRQRFTSRCVTTAHTGADPDVPTNISYTVAFIDNPAIPAESGVTPANRVVRAGPLKIKPAPDGSHMLAHRFPDGSGGFTVVYELLEIEEPNWGPCETLP